MRVLGIDTSSRRGSVALVEDGREVVALTHESAASHAERTLALVDEVLASAAWARTSLDRIAVGVGPGSFTGLRVGIALAQGMGLGLGRPVLGVGALLAMCRGVPGDAPRGSTGMRCALLDARREEVFAGAYDADGREHAAPFVLTRAAVADWVASFGGTPEPLVIGEIARAIVLPQAPFGSERTDLPHAACVALLGAELSEDTAVPEPVYVRPADAIRPNLPRSPLSSGEAT